MSDPSKHHLKPEIKGVDNLFPVQVRKRPSRGGMWRESCPELLRLLHAKHNEPPRDFLGEIRVTFSHFAGREKSWT